MHFVSQFSSLPTYAKFLVVIFVVLVAVSNLHVGISLNINSKLSNMIEDVSVIQVDISTIKANISAMLEDMTIVKCMLEIE